VSCPIFFKANVVQIVQNQYCKPHSKHAPIELLIVDQRSALSSPSPQLLPSIIMICI
jgi:hypothetical protein